VTGTVHALSGAAIGALLRRPGRAFVAGVISHGVLDCVPHRDYERSTGLAPDILGLLAVLWFAVRSGRPEVVAGAIGGLIPDIENVLPDTETGMPKLFPSHWFRHQDRVTARAETIEWAVGAVAVCFLLACQVVLRRPGRAHSRSRACDAG
jgi:hypothetical protein